MRATDFFFSNNNFIGVVGKKKAEVSRRRRIMMIDEKRRRLSVHLYASTKFLTSSRRMEIIVLHRPVPHPNDLARSTTQAAPGVAVDTAEEETGRAWSVNQLCKQSSQQYGSQVDPSPIKKGRSNADGSVHLNRLAEFPVLSDDMLVAEENSTFDDEKGDYSDSSSDSDGSDDMFQTNSYQRRKNNQN